MKNFALIAATSLYSCLAFADCPALDYQEMKEMKPDDLSKEYCKVKIKTARYTADSRLERKYSNDLKDLNLISRSRAREDDADEAMSKSLKLQESADQCHSQETRIERVLILNGLPEADVKTMCPK